MAVPPASHAAVSTASHRPSSGRPQPQPLMAVGNWAGRPLHGGSLALAQERCSRQVGLQWG